MGISTRQTAQSENVFALVLRHFPGDAIGIINPIRALTSQDEDPSTITRSTYCFRPYRTWLRIHLSNPLAQTHNDIDLASGKQEILPVPAQPSFYRHTITG